VATTDPQETIQMELYIKCTPILIPLPRHTKLQDEGAHPPYEYSSNREATLSGRHTSEHCYYQLDFLTPPPPASHITLAAPNYL